MSDNYRWDGDVYQGKPEGENKYEYYKVENEKSAQEAQSDYTSQASSAEHQASAESAAADSTGSASQGSSAYQGAGGQGNGTYQGAGGGQSERPLFQRPPRPERPKRQKNPNSVGRKFGMTVSLALVFGLVAGLMFQGVNVVSDHFFGEEEISQPQLQSTSLVQQSEDAAAAGSSSASAMSSNSVSAVAASAMPSLVAITTVSVQEMQSFFGGSQQYESVSSGSGVIVGENDTELLIATNNHVVEDAKELSVCFIGNDVVSAEETEQVLMENGGLDIDGAVSASIKGTDPENDLAVVAVKKEDVPEETMAEIKIAQIGDSDGLAVGEQVVAIGNALGYGQSVTSGYVSALNRTVTFEDSTSSQMIQTDAAINPGNSGGALLNMQGQLIGINSAKEASNYVEGMGYAIPINTASPILDDLMTRETREVVDENKAAYLGVSVTDVPDQAIEMYNMVQGAFVKSVTEGSAAEKAGILQNDIITKLDGQTVTGRDDLLDKLQYYAAGETVEITVNRADNGQYVDKTLEITFDKRPSDLNQ